MKSVLGSHRWFIFGTFKCQKGGTHEGEKLNIGHFTYGLVSKCGGIKFVDGFRRFSFIFLGG